MEYELARECGLVNSASNTLSVTIGSDTSGCCNMATTIFSTESSMRDYLSEMFKAAGISTEKKKTKREIDLENKRAFEKLDPIQKVKFNEGRLGWSTTVLWKDGTKTTVVCDPEDEFSQEVGIAMCFMKKQMGNKGSYNNIFKKHCTEITTKLTDKDGQTRLY